MTAKELWDQYVQARQPACTAYQAWQFGGAPDKLADLVLHGIKTATSSLHCLYQYDQEELPMAGEYSEILDSKDEAVCIIRTTSVELLPYSSVTAEQARKEGEGDRSLSYWRAVHREFFSNELTAYGKSFSPDMIVVFEEFSLVWPPQG